MQTNQKKSVSSENAYYHQIEELRRTINSMLSQIWDDRLYACYHQLPCDYSSLENLESHRVFLAEVEYHLAEKKAKEIARAEQRYHEACARIREWEADVSYGFGGWGYTGFFDRNSRDLARMPPEKVPLVIEEELAYDLWQSLLDNNYWQRKNEYLQRWNALNNDNNRSNDVEEKPSFCHIL